MKVRLVAFAVVFAGVASLFAQEAAKCTAAARQCDREIRQMLSGRRYLGIQIIELKPGILIKVINDDGPARNVDLLPGDRILAVNGRSMKYGNAREFKSVLGEAKDAGGLVQLLVQRQTVVRKVEVRLEPYPKEQLDKIIAAHLQKSHPGAAGSP